MLTIQGLEKSYPGRQALCGVDMTLAPGRITGLLGPNASGKTTLLKCIAGLLAPDRGEILYPGDVKSGTEARAAVAMLPDHLAFPRWMKVKDAFRFYEEMYPDYSKTRAAQLLELLELSPEASIRRLSKGMQERVALGVTFSRAAALYLLDEPLGGIDPVGKMKVLDSILSTELSGSAILLSTHLVRDVEAILDDVRFLSEGRIVFADSAEAIREQSGRTVEQAYLEVFSHVKTV